MSTIIKNGTAQNVKYGVDDQSVPPTVVEQVPVPIHLPLIFDFAPKGEVGAAHVVYGSTAKSLYGDLFNLKSPYTTFNTPFAELFNRNANPIMFQRVVPQDASTGSMRLYAEVVPSKVPQYERNFDGSIVYENGVKKVKGEIDGVLIIWRTGQINEESGKYRQATPFEGSVSTDQGKSTVYPIMDIPGPYPGASVNNYGLSLYCQNATSTVSSDPDIARTVGGRVMGMQWLEQVEEGVKPSITPTLKGQNAISFSFKPNAYYRPMRMELDFEDIALKSWRDRSTMDGTPPVLGPCSDMYVYRDYLEKVLSDAAEVIRDDEDVVGNPYMVDIFTGLDLEGNPYNGLLVDSGEQGGELLTYGHVHYMSGGSDGTMDNETFDKLVREEMRNYGNGTVKYDAILKYPNSYLWDSGFSTDTKEQMCNYIGRYKHTNLILVPHVFNEGVNDMQTEEAMKVALSAMLRSMPESVYYGTGTMRGHIVGHSMYLNNSQYKERVPVSYSLANKASLYAGSMEGRFKPAYRFSRGELTIIDEGYDFNLDYKPFPVYVSDWDTGLISLRAFDQYRYHFPALYSVHQDDRSVLNSWLISMVVGNLQMITERVWAEMSGVSDKTDGEIIKMVRNKLIKKTDGIYDGVVNLEFEPYFSEIDIANGNSISLNVHFYGATMKTVFKTTLVAHRFQTQEG